MHDVSESREFLDGLLRQLSSKKLLISVDAHPGHLLPLCRGLVARSKLDEKQTDSEREDLFAAGKGLWELVHSPHYANYAPGRNVDHDRQFIEGLTDGYTGVRAQKSPAYLDGNKLGKELAPQIL